MRAITTVLVVSDVEKAKAFYTEVLGADLHREYGGGGPTPDKPTTVFGAPADLDRVDHAFTIRVDNCNAVYADLLARGAEFLTPPVTSEGGHETRAFFRDPDGHLFEISQAH